MSSCISQAAGVCPNGVARQVEDHLNERRRLASTAEFCLRKISAFNLAAVELRTDCHQHQDNKTDGQNYEAVDGP